MQNRLTSYVLAATTLAFLVTPACYTLLKHPRVKRVIYEEVTDRRCNGCHQEDELWAFHHPPNQRLRAPGHSVWNRYYDIPWWYNEYWYYDHDAPDAPHAQAFGEGAGRIPARRRADALRSQRGNSSPPPVDTDLVNPARKGSSRHEASKKRTA